MSAVMGATLAEQAYVRLEELIVTLKLAPGRVVSEQELSELLGIGRTPIREALHRLSTQKLVRVLPRLGIVVSEIDVKAQLRLLEVRRELERLLCRAAAKRATPEERQRFAALEGEFRACAASCEEERFMRADRAFNDLVLQAARNEFAASALGMMNSLSRRFWFLHYRQAADLPLTARLHADVAGAIAAGQPDTAAAACNALLDTIAEFTRATVTTEF
jgi:DNA-binding GntR family transcriptional regulator